MTAVLDYQLRPAVPHDVVSLHRTCWSNLPFDLVRVMFERATTRAERGQGHALVASSGPHIIGFGQIIHWPRATEISDLVVAAPHRCRGVGTAMIMHLLAVIRERRIAVAEIGAALSNPRALALYRRLGFIDDRLVDLDLGHGLEPVQYLIMRLDT